MSDIVPAAGRTATLEALARVLRRADRRLKTPRSMELVDALAFSAAGTVLEHDLPKPYRQGQERAVH